MKKLTFLAAVTLLLLAIPIRGQAQTIKVGGGVELRSEPPAAMITKITYNLGVLDPNLRISLDAAIIPDFEGNLDMHYSFVKESGFDAYALAGVNMAHRWGGNAGAGVNFELSESLDAFGEVKYLINRSPQASIKLGLLYKL